MTVIELQSGTVAMEGYFLFELVVPSKNFLFPFLFGHFLTIPPLRSAFPIHDVNIHKTNGIGGNNTSAPIGKADLQNKYSNKWDFVDFLGVHLMALIQKGN